MREKRDGGPTKVSSEIIKEYKLSKNESIYNILSFSLTFPTNLFNVKRNG